MLANNKPKRGLILIIDDNVSMIHMLSAALSAYGDVLFATDGESGVRLASETRPELILVDVEMPEMDGFEVCARLKANPLTQDSAVIFVTAHTDKEHEVRALAAGAVDFIPKPVNFSVARARVETHLTIKRQSDELTRTQDDLKAILDHMPAMIGYWDRSLRNRFCNYAYRDWFGVKPEDVRGKHLKELFGEAYFNDNLNVLEKTLAGEAQSFERTFTSLYGSVRHAQISYIPDLKEGEVRGFFVLGTDVTALKRAELALHDEKEALRVTLNTIGDAVIATDRYACINFMNPIAEEMTGWNAADAVGRSIEEVMDLRDGTSRARVTNPVRFALRENRTVGMALNCVLVRRDRMEFSLEDSAAPIHDDTGETSGAIIVFHDVSEARAMALKMAHLTQYDALTDLPNRVLLQDRINQAITAASRHDGRFALMILDLDHFKYVNDSLGHAIGDELLRAIAGRLTNCLRSTDTVSRRGGDEFILLLPQIESSEAVGQMADKLIQAVSTSYEVAGTKLVATFSMGIALYPEDGRDQESLLRNADAAMYQAKQSGRNRYQFYSSEIGDLILARHALEQHMREALDGGAFSVFFQPQVDARRNVVVGVEALVRWRRDDGRLVPPSEFIPLAEETGLIVALGKFVLLEACRQNRRWQEMGFAPMRVAVNISAMQFAQPDFTEMVQTTLAEAGLRPCYLELEVTEGTMLIDTERTRAVLNDLKATGISVAIDDFGTGYSSLAYLKRFPVDVLKVDQSFIRDLLSDANDAAIVAAVISLANSLGLSLVAEGVEQLEQMDHLLLMGCEVMQGYLFARPMDAEEVTMVLHDWDNVPG